MQEMTLAQEANPWFMFVVPCAAAHREKVCLRPASGAGGVFWKIELIYHFPRSYSIRLFVEHSCMSLA